MKQLEFCFGDKIKRDELIINNEKLDDKEFYLDGKIYVFKRFKSIKKETIEKYNYKLAPLVSNENRIFIFDSNDNLIDTMHCYATGISGNFKIEDYWDI